MSGFCACVSVAEMPREKMGVPDRFSLIILILEKICLKGVLSPMVEEKTNDAIRRFKAFLRKHPEIVAHVQENGLKWQNVFDEWVIFGESHEIWASYGVKTEKGADGGSKSGGGLSLGKFLDALDRMDAQQWQDRLNTLSGALTGIQQLIGQFRQEEGEPGGAGRQNQDAERADGTGRMTEAAGPGPAGSGGPFFFRRE